MMLITLHVEETEALGRLIGALAPALPATTCITLEGPLGAGKTQLARGIAAGAGVDDLSLVSSPTYVLLNIYRGPKPVFHLDAYRVASGEDFAAVGFEELLAGGGIVIVEWAARIAELLPADRLEVILRHGAATEGETVRHIDIKGTGPDSVLLAEELESRRRSGALMRRMRGRRGGGQLCHGQSSRRGPAPLRGLDD